ncbi:MAG TPA: peptidase S10 [Bryobacteraceae bacterium]|jgi:carboxypeptidase C (cathepsin A)|nr:peptidase S10 [Bryobacteraceae bacterium]
MRLKGIVALSATLLVSCFVSSAQRSQSAEQTPGPSMTTPPGQAPQRGGGQRQQQPQESNPQLSQSGRAQGETRAAAPPVEKSSVTHHRARIAGEEIAYTATAGTYVIKADDGTPKATIFFVAYTRDGVQDLTRRPVSFVYNGGPGSASCFTHMGLGPRRVALEADGHGMPAPYVLEDNRDSFLDATDMIFIDAISTGYSRPVQGESPNQFHGVIEDANWFADFIYQYVTRNERWASPKYLIGESYGTTRSAELSGVLQERHQLYLNGIILLSSVAFSNFGADDRNVFFLPTYVTTAWYHHLLSPDLQKLTVDQIAEKGREFAHGEYAQALDKGDRLTKEEYDKVVADMARYTGLSPKYIMEANLRVTPFRWFKELERDKRRTVGRLDSRFEGMEADAAGERVEYDASEASYEGAYVAAFQDYVRRELKWDSDMYYTVTARVQPWDQTGNTAVAEVLRAAMTQQTYLKVLVLCGYYDVATPFNGIEHTVNHMGLEPPVRKNISFAYYESGHMVYIDQKAGDKLRKDVLGFINGSYKHGAEEGVSAAGNQQ